MDSDINNDLIIKRLNRIEGQIKGIKKMLNDEKYCCSDILTQVSAVRAAVNKVGLIIFEKHSKTCLQDLKSLEDTEKVMEDLIMNMQRFVRFYD